VEIHLTPILRIIDHTTIEVTGAHHKERLVNIRANKTQAIKTIGRNIIAIHNVEANTKTKTYQS
jgi:hypothetical protein